MFFIFFFYPKMCILEIQQMKIFDFFQSRNDFYQTVPSFIDLMVSYWLHLHQIFFKINTHLF